MAQLVPGWRAERLEAVPPVVRVDGIWITLMVPTGEERIDRMGRRRAVKRARKVPILVAQGVWPALERQEVVAWTLGRAEDEESWEQLLTQMWERGISVERGLMLLVGDGAAGLTEARRTVYWNVPFQRCIFHKLRNVWRAIVLPEGVEGKAARAYKRRLIRSAARVWRATDKQEARRRQHAFCRRWEAEQPAVAASMRRDFQATLTFYDVQAAAAARGEVWPARLLRTTSPLERQFRTFRKRFSQAVLFHSLKGLTAVVHQVLVRCTTRRIGALPLTWQHTLERALADARPFS
jgi:transposase-like protein